jgi:hypothetical protein
VEDDDHQKRLERVTSDSYPENISPYDTNPAGDDKPTNKGTPNGALHAALVETARNSGCKRVTY